MSLSHTESSSFIHGLSENLSPNLGSYLLLLMMSSSFFIHIAYWLDRIWFLNWVNHRWKWSTGLRFRTFVSLTNIGHKISIVLHQERFCWENKWRKSHVGPKALVSYVTVTCNITSHKKNVAWWDHFLCDWIFIKKEKGTNLLDWLIIHNHPWYKSMWWIELSCFLGIFLFNLCIKYEFGI